MTTFTSLFLSTAGAWIGQRLGARGRVQRAHDPDGIGFEDTVPMDVPSDFATLLPEAEPAPAFEAADRHEPAMALPPPSEYLARWSIDYDSCQGDAQPHAVYVLRVHTRLMCLMCYCEFNGSLRTFSWSGIRAVRDTATGKPVDFEAWIAAHMAQQFDVKPRPTLGTVRALVTH
jgi:hypothetical protein